MPPRKGPERANQVTRDVPMHRRGLYVNGRNLSDFFLDLRNALQFRHLMEEELELNEAARLVKGVSTYDDTATWRSRKSFRSGYLIIGKETDVPLLPPRDFTLILHSPLADHSPCQIAQNQVIVGAALSDELMHRLQHIEAATQLARAGEHRKTFESIARREASEFKDRYLAWLIQEGYAVHGGVK